jgi:hypothetical protein
MGQIPDSAAVCRRLIPSIPGSIRSSTRMSAVAFQQGKGFQTVLAAAYIVAALQGFGQGKTKIFRSLCDQYLTRIHDVTAFVLSF